MTPPALLKTFRDPASVYLTMLLLARIVGVWTLLSDFSRKDSIRPSISSLFSYELFEQERLLTASRPLTSVTVPALSVDTYLNFRRSTMSFS